MVTGASRHRADTPEYSAAPPPAVSLSVFILSSAGTLRGRGPPMGTETGGDLDAAAGDRSLNKTECYEKPIGGQRSGRGCKVFLASD